MLALKVLICLALSALMLVPVAMHRTILPAAQQMAQAPNVDGQAMWSLWPSQ